MQQAFVTGASGFVGSEVAMVLLDAGWSVTAACRPTSDRSAFEGRDIEWAEVDLHDEDSVAKAMPDGVDCVFHVAGNSTFWPREFEAQYRDNVIGTRAVARAALARDAGRFVYTSSGAAYGRQDEPLHEGMTSRALESPVNYDRTKYLGECEVRSCIADGLDAVILNPAAVLGPRDPNFTILFEQIARGRLPFTFPSETSYCHSHAVALAHLSAFERGRTGENYLLGGENASQLELARIIADVVGATPPRWVLPVRGLWAVGAVLEAVSAVTGRPPMITRTFATTMTHCWYTCSDKAKSELGYDPPPMRQIVEDVVAWLQDEGRLPARM